MLDEGHRRVLILEDDVLPQYDHLQRFDEVISQVPEDWELLMLGYYGHKPPSLRYRIQQQIYRGFTTFASQTGTRSVETGLTTFACGALT